MNFEYVQLTSKYGCILHRFGPIIITSRNILTTFCLGPYRKIIESARSVKSWVRFESGNQQGHILLP